jgi:hypothetical protein
MTVTTGNAPEFPRHGPHQPSYSVPDRTAEESPGMSPRPTNPPP